MSYVIKHMFFMENVFRGIEITSSIEQKHRESSNYHISNAYSCTMINYIMTRSTGGSCSSPVCWKPSAVAGGASHRGMVEVKGLVVTAKQENNCFCLQIRFTITQDFRMERNWNQNHTSMKTSIGITKL